MKRTTMFGYLDDGEDPFLPEDLKTPQEHILIASSPAGFEPHEFYIPVGVAKGMLTVEQAREHRASRGFYTGGLWNIQPYMVAVKFQDLDENGRTNEDPEVLGAFNITDDESGEGEIIQIEGRDINKELYHSVAARVKEAKYGEISEMLIRHKIDEKEVSKGNPETE